jgi:hypothetical protein
MHVAHRFHGPSGPKRSRMRIACRLVLGLLAAAPGVPGSARAGEAQGADPPVAPALQPLEFRTALAGNNHRFWDSSNLALFAGVAASRGLDYASTRHFRARGNDEYVLTNEIVDNEPLFMGIEVAGAAASIGLSYLLHRTGHHTAERWLSVFHFGVAGYGAARNYSL